MKPSSTTTSGKATDMIARICTFPHLPCPCTKGHITLNLTSTGVCNTGTSALYVRNLLLSLTWRLRKVTSTNMTKKMYVVTPICAAAAAVVSAAVVRRPTTEYTHPYSMMHRRLPTAGIDIAPYCHQLLEPSDDPSDNTKQYVFDKLPTRRFQRRPCWRVHRSSCADI